MMRLGGAWLLLVVVVTWLSTAEGLTPASPEMHNMHTAKGQKLDSSTARTYSDRTDDAWEMMCIGFIIFTMSFPFVVLVEWDSVSFLAMLSRMKKVCYAIPSDQVQDKHDNFGAVYVSGKLRSDQGELNDTEVGYFPKRKCVAIRRVVEKMVAREYRTKTKHEKIIQTRLEWEEVARRGVLEEDDDGTHPYEIAAALEELKQANCGGKYLGSAILVASPVWLGAFELGNQHLWRIDEWSDCDMLEDSDRCFVPAIDGLVLQTADQAWTEKRPEAHERFWSYFKHISPVAPKHLKDEIHEREAPPTYALYGTGKEAGSVRISYKALYEDEVVSFCAVQTRNTLRRFQMNLDGVTESRDARILKIANRYEEIEAAAGTDEDPDDIEWTKSSISPCLPSWRKMLEWVRIWTGSIFPQKLLMAAKGPKAKADFFHEEYWACMKKVWMMRVWGFFGFTLGFYCMCSPIWEVVSFLPWIDFLLAHFFWVVSIIVGLILVTAVASVAWVLFHPEFLGLLLAGIGLAFHYNAVLGPECTIPEGEMHSGGAREFQSCPRDMEVGWAFLGVAAVPLLIYVYRFIDEWRYVALVEEGMREADKESKV